MLEKTDSRGNYLEFPGVTVIANVGKANQELWQNIHSFIVDSPTLRTYFAPLPLQSYHMTTCDLYTKDEHPDWISFISAKLSDFQKLNEKLVAMQFNPSITIETVRFFPVLQLMLTIPAEQSAIIEQVAQEFGLQNKIPGVFHITLAYGYRDIDDEERLEAINKEVIKLMSLCQQYDKKLVLSAPQLSFFHNMKEFTVWDGVTNPFVTQQTHVNTLSIFTHKNKSQKETPTSVTCTIM